MQLSKTSYYADFVVYAVVILGMTLIAAVTGDWLDRLRWASACTVGIALWTLLEYVLHRFAFHGRTMFAPMHARHHVAPKAYIGTPTWLSLAILAVGIFLPVWGLSSRNVASGVTAGVMLGFFIYGLLHHAIHHRRPRLLMAWLGTATRRHMHHHHAVRGGNYGVTTQLWDLVFGTVLDRPSVRTVSSGPEPCNEGS